MGVKTWLLTSFREIFLYHYKSLEFRAEVLALVIAPTCGQGRKWDSETLKQTAAEIYPSDHHRRDVLINIVKNYIALILRHSDAYDEAVRDINRKIKANRTLGSKINMEHVRRFERDDMEEEHRLLQTRIIEFLDSAAKENEEVPPQAS
jgi:hypothetical protein